ncbi:MAG: hypothetical protein A3F84_23710 [Candidatus Handelsmanbacteria bacterium RIFCSPLOWO2_12_FULL_64_10]|uniref:HTH cro/C1-type domain-containing protein n=1 Tax=Handelsmanbacteria sp. (strain RIFCSPLOWO2_12_FULL_64_10) TaxID=1817868 RepID=A0A1F6CD84_HANXR|nr:MAG: hypothetical protein A3F84_23710 [Candidatus Handelsmanbacteria bacterium RIFCSPLOWO2_12_FULL_64_10]
MRAQRDWTQADLAQRLAASRVAVSHFEIGLAVPSERTILLLAGLFKLAPGDLVAGTDYPVAKTERLPPSAPCYTEVELRLALLHRDLYWLTQLAPGTERRRLATELAARWASEFTNLEGEALDRQERASVKAAALRLQEVLTAELVQHPASV